MPRFLFLETWDTVGTHKDIFYCHRCWHINFAEQMHVGEGDTHCESWLLSETWKYVYFLKLVMRHYWLVYCDWWCLYFGLLAAKNRNKTIPPPVLLPFSCFGALHCRTVALMWGGLWSPASRLAAVGVMATGLSATASVAMSTTTAVRWGLRRRPICTRPRPLPSTPGSAERRSWCALWRLL